MSGYSGFKTDDYIYKPKGGFTGTFGESDFKYDSGTSKWKEGAKDFLTAFAKGLGDRDKYRDQAESPTFGPTSRNEGSVGTGGLAGELSFVNPSGPSFGGMHIPGQPGEEGVLPKIGRTAAAIGAGALTGGWGGAAAGALTSVPNFF